MKTLVYFASGPIREEYKELYFDRIYLIDNCFKYGNRYPKQIFKIDNITCVGMDCLESIAFLKKENVQIDCFVSLNEGLYEGGGSYAINSDMFLGYAMPLFKEQYIHIMNKNYYHNMYHVSMDLPYDIEEIKEDDYRYLSPFIFSKNNYHRGHAKVFQMRKLAMIKTQIIINPHLKLQIIHDSIWNYYEELDALIISFSDQGQRDFFDKIPKVINLLRTNIDEIFEFCQNNKVRRIGFTPFGRGKYISFLEKLKNLKNEYPKEILLFHLNKNDYKEIKKYAGNSTYT
ncbi:MAG: hypothetical protein ACK4EX_09225 [Thermaurantimonas sp.]|uniref:hypothetical protein n=1 Tax=Thermaurantimonas sp. TaxID=2681568 RepID=UPI00391D61E9